MSATNVYHATLTDGDVFGVWADTLTDARRYLHERLERDENGASVAAIHKVGRGTASYGTVLHY